MTFVLRAALGSFRPTMATAALAGCGARTLLDLSDSPASGGTERLFVYGEPSDGHSLSPIGAGTIFTCPGSSPR